MNKAEVGHKVRSFVQEIKDIQNKHPEKSLWPQVRTENLLSEWHTQLEKSEEEQGGVIPQSPEFQGINMTSIQDHKKVDRKSVV